MLGKFPMLNWNNDTYRNWLQTNGMSLGVQGASSLLTLGIGAMLLAPETAGTSLALAGTYAIVSGVTGVGSAVAQVYEHSKMPDTLQGDTTGADINVCSNKNGFFFYKHSIKNEFANIIDKYFSMAGYKVNAIKIPNIEGRTNWNFVKTRDCNIEGTLIPEKDLNKLKSMFNAGITFWHNYVTFRDYSQSNNIVT